MKSHVRPRAAALLVLLIVAGASVSLARDPLGTSVDAERVGRLMREAGVQGGLVVHLGCGDGRLTAALHQGNNFIVHGLDTSPEDVRAARERIASQGLYGRVSIERLQGDALPYVDNLVNLLVAEELGDVPMREVLRVLAPRGVACIRVDGEWTTTVKPTPEEIDEWTHYLHGPGNNAVAQDKIVAPPQHIQWVGDPKWARHHNYLASMSAMVSSQGRIIAVVDEGPTASVAFPAQWRLVARDAFNGVVLWKRTLKTWEGHLRPFRSGPNALPRRLVAVGDQVFVTLGYGEPVSLLDAATGETVKTFAGTEQTEEILYVDGMLYLVGGDPERDQNDEPARASKDFVEAAKRRGASPAVRAKRVQAVDVATGEIRWTREDQETAELMSATLCVQDSRLFFQNPAAVVCLDSRSGEPVWRVSRPIGIERFSWSTPTLVVHGDVVLTADRGLSGKEPQSPTSSTEVTWNVSSGTLDKNLADAGELVAYSAASGERLWSCPSGPGYNSPADVFVADGLVWVGTRSNPIDPPFAEGRDLHTGEVRRTLQTLKAFEQPHHHRCYRNKATDQYLLLGRSGVEFLGLDGQEPLLNNWIRGTCQYGVMPCNGLLYLPPHSCACYIQSKLSGLHALAPARASDALPDSPRFELGPAYSAAGSRDFKGADDTWPTYRGDASRSGTTNAELSTALTSRWQVKLGGKITSPVIDDGRLLVASPETHAVHALDAASGKKLWSYTAGGRVDSPPTLYRGLALFGCADGWVYCLRAADGALVWRFRAAPADRRVVAFGQLESVWPVPGNVLVVEGVAYVAAGRSSYLDGGMRLVRLNAADGELLGETILDDRNPATGEQQITEMPDVDLPGALPDVLSYDGESIFLRDVRFDRQGNKLPSNVAHLYSPAGFLDDSWWHRTYWIHGSSMFGRARNWYVMGNNVPSGRIMSVRGASIFSFGRQRYGGDPMGLEPSEHLLFRADRDVKQMSKMMGTVGRANEVTATKVYVHWAHESPFIVRAMLLAGDILFVAGPPWSDSPRTASSSFDADRGATLRAVSIQDGSVLAEQHLENVPRFDGMAAAYDSLFITTEDGSVICLGAR